MPSENRILDNCVAQTPGCRVFAKCVGVFQHQGLFSDDCYQVPLKIAEELEGIIFPTAFCRFGTNKVTETCENWVDETTWNTEFRLITSENQFLFRATFNFVDALKFSELSTFF